MITVHHLERSRSKRVLWLLKEMGLPYTVISYPRDPETMLAPPSLKSLHKLGKSPIITHNHRVLAETGAILEYILSLQGSAHLVPPAGTTEHASYLYWLHAAEGSIMPPIVFRLVIGAAVAACPPDLLPAAARFRDRLEQTYLEPQITNVLDLAEESLNTVDFFAGSEFTAADIMMCAPIESAHLRAMLGNRPNLLAWITRIQSRPAYRATIEEHGP